MREILRKLPDPEYGFVTVKVPLELKMRLVKECQSLGLSLTSLVRHKLCHVTVAITTRETHEMP
jgi:hypothetical protein